MISLDKAKTLKEAGLEWEPTNGDCVSDSIWGGDIGLVTGVSKYNGSHVFTLRFLEGGYHVTKAKHCIWLPRLDQLLSEICRHENLAIQLTRIDGQSKWQFYCGATAKMYYADTSEDAVASALIQILQQRY